MKKKTTIAVSFLNSFCKFSLVVFSICLYSNQCFAQASCPLNGNLTVNNDTSICAGLTVNLSASGGGNSYTWTASPADTSLTTPNIANPIVRPFVNTIYTVTSSGLNVLTNGDFENGNVGFTSNYTYVTGSTFNSGSYSINANPSNQNSFFTTCGDHTTGTGKMLVVDGATDSTTKLWCETVTVIPNATYTFSYWIQDLSNAVNGDGHPAALNTQINGNSIGIGASPVFGLPCGQWAQKSFTWNSGNATSADICINDTAIEPNGNDFALDDISFGTSCTFTNSVTVTATACHIPLSIQASHVDADCTNGNGSITVSGVNGSGTPPYTYSLNGAPFSSTNVFSGLSGGSYQVSVRDAAVPTPAEVDTTIIIAPGTTLIVNNDTTICLSGSAMLSVSGGSNYTWTASPADPSLTTPNIANPVVKPLVTTVYTVTSGTPPSTNLVVNPSFENGNTGFTSNYTYVTGSTFNAGSYSIRNNPSGQNSFFTTCGDHTSGTGNMMVVDGATDSTIKLWCESVPVSPNTIYTFSYWIQDLSNTANGDGHPGALNTQINGSSIGIGMDPVHGFPCSDTNWVQKSFTWNSGNASSADICINDTAIEPNGNDYAVDDIFFGTAGCTTSKSVTVTITQCNIPLAIQGSHVDADCTNGNGSITVSGVIGTGTSPYTYSLNGGSFSSDSIFSGLSGGSYQVSVRDAATPTPAQHDTTITVLAGTPLTVSNDTSICIGTSVTLSANGGVGSVYSWVASPTDPSLTTPTIANPVVKPTVTTVYTVTSSSSSSNLLANPSFENGYNGFISEYTIANPIPFSTGQHGVYGLVTDANLLNTSFLNFGDHTTGTGNMFVSDGPISANNLKVWSEIIPVTPNTNYTFSYYLRAASSGTPSTMEAQINGVTLTGSANPATTTTSWVQLSYTWNSGNATSADIDLYDRNFVQAGNDFALDDLSFGIICTTSKSVTVTTTQCNIPLAIQGSHVDADCTNGNGSITVSGVIGSGISPYTYSLNGGPFSSTNIFSGLNGGSYQVSVRDAATPTPAEVDTTIIIAPGTTLIVRNDTTICISGSVPLSVSGGNSYTWTASPADPSLTTPNIANPVVSPLVTTVYTVTSGTPPSANLIVNPSFENGNTGFSSQYTYVTGSTFNAGSYSIRTNPSGQNSFFSTCGDHTSGTGNMMVVDGATDGISKLWCESVLVAPNTIYTFSYWIQDVSNSVNGDGHPAGLNAQINGNSVGIGISPVLGLPCGQWVQKSFTWNSGNVTSADICINDTTTFPNGNDYAVDDIFFGTAGCTTSKSVTVNVNAATQAPTSNPVTYCQNVVAVPLSATGAGLLWYTTSVGGVGSATPPIPSTSTIGTATYYVSQTGQPCGESPRTPLIVIVNPNPVANAGADTSIFLGESVVLNGTPTIGGTYLWNDPSASTSLSVQVTPQITTTYTLQVTDNGCSSSDDVIVTVKPDECITLMRVFTPNKDGYNDLWKVYSGDCYKQVLVNVYNRWGSLVYHSDNYTNNWDGTYKGKPLPDATYYYVIEVTKISGSKNTLTGNVTIIR